MLSHRLMIGNVAHTTTEADLVNAFQQCGAVTRLVWTRVAARGVHASAYIEMETSEGARSAIDVFDRQVFDGRCIGVRFA